MEYCGIDLHTKSSQVAIIDEGGELCEKAEIPTTESSFVRYFGKREPMVICLEVGGVSAWAQRLLTGLGHQVVVANPLRVRLIAEATLKNDAVDALTLARLVRADPQLLSPVVHRSETTQRQRAVLRVRAVLVNSRTACVNAARGLLRSLGFRLPKQLNGARLARAIGEKDIPDDLAALVAPLVMTALELDEKIAALDKQVKAIGANYPEVALLQTVPGVGPLVALAFVLCLENPRRFRRSRDVGAYLGLRPRMRETGSTSRYGSITHAGDREVRWLLVEAAHGMLRSRRDCDLKDWALRLASRVGKKKAITALARKLAVVMHTMWITGKEFRSFRQAIDVAA